MGKFNNEIDQLMQIAHQINFGQIEEDMNKIVQKIHDEAYEAGKIYQEHMDKENMCKDCGKWQKGYNEGVHDREIEANQECNNCERIAEPCPENRGV
jgi:methionyl-tRNA synthetase